MRILAREVFEGLAGADACRQFLRLFLRRILVIAEGDKDMPRAALLIMQITIFGNLVVVRKRLFGDFNLLVQHIAPDFYIFDIGRFRQGEFARSGVIECDDFFFADFFGFGIGC